MGHLCQSCGTAPVRKRRGAKFCSRCVAKLPKKTCRDCNATVQTDMMRGPRCGLCARKKNRDGRLKSVYSISEHDYQRILTAQGHACAICRRALVRKAYSVDHDHACCNGPTSCGQCVRGLLCQVCNKYLGYVRDNPNVGENLRAYLILPPAHKVLPRTVST